MELDRQKGIKKKGEEKEGRNSRFQNLRDLLKSVHFHQMSFRTASWVTLYQNSSWDFSEIWSEWASLCSGDLAPLPSMPKWPRPTLTVDGNTPQGTNTVSSSPCPCLELPLLSLLVIWFPSSPLLFPPPSPPDYVKHYGWDGLALKVSPRSHLEPKNLCLEVTEKM